MYDYDCVINERRVLCGECALNRVGLVHFNSDHLHLMTDQPDFDNFSMVYMTYFYYPVIDFTNWVSPCRTNKLLLLPTRERAIIDYLRCENHCDEGYLIEALKNYLEQFQDLPKLREVATFYDVPLETLDYWINEALTDEEI